MPCVPEDGIGMSSNKDDPRIRLSLLTGSRVLESFMAGENHHAHSDIPAAKTSKPF